MFPNGFSNHVRQQRITINLAFSPAECGRACVSQITPPPHSPHPSPLRHLPSVLSDRIFPETLGRSQRTLGPLCEFRECCWRHKEPGRAEPSRAEDWHREEERRNRTEHKRIRVQLRGFLSAFCRVPFHFGSLFSRFWPHFLRCARIFILFFSSCETSHNARRPAVREDSGSTTAWKFLKDLTSESSSLVRRCPALFNPVFKFKFKKQPQMHE